jgi:predicted ATPase/class 3 adenylate cyclase/Tfp pilus assembly protein PilF
MVVQPTGTVTLLFSDIEASTRLLERLGADPYGRVLERHRELLRAAFAAHEGYEVDCEGDAFFVAFPSATDAVTAAAEAQRSLVAEPWPEECEVRVRIGIHTGEPLAAPPKYVGLDVHRAARVMAAAHGGQVLVTQPTSDLLDPSFAVRDLGLHRLKDLSAPLRLFQLGEGESAPLRTLRQTNLPVQPYPLVGRERELEQIAAFVRGGTRLLTLTGPGGSGKTRLALHAAAELAELFPDGVWFVPLAPVDDAQLVVGAIVHAAAPDGGRAAVASMRALLVLDNMEQLLAAGPQVAELLAAGPALHVLVTSRERLWVGGEQEFPVEPLPVADAVALFAEAARRLVPSFEPDWEVAEIAARLDGLPLALELAAARVKLLSPAQIRARLDHSLDLLTGGPRDAPSRQRTLRATIEWSHDLLSQEEQRLFARLAIFAGTFSIEGAEEVAEASLDDLAALVDKNLLRAGRDGRFYLLATIREFALERLAASDEEDELRERLLQHLLSLFPADPWAPTTRDELTSARKMFDAELENVRATLAWLLDGDRPGAPDLLYRPFAFWDERGAVPEWLGWSERALAGSDRSEVRADLLWRTAIAEAAVGDAVRAVAFAEEALDLLRPRGPGKRLALALRGSAEAHWRAGDVENGRRLFEQALEQIDPDAELRVVVSLLQNYGWFELEDGNVAVAQNLLERALAGARQFPGTVHASLILDSLVTAALLAGDARRAAALYREAIVEAHAIGARRGLTCLLGLAAAEARAGERDYAALLWGAGERALERSASYSVYELKLFREATHDLDPTLVEQGRSLNEEQAYELAITPTTDRAAVR